MGSMFIGIIILLIAFGVLVATQLKIFNVGEKLLEGKDCQVALGLQKASEKVPFITYKNACETIYVDIPQKRKRLVDSNADISKEIADLMMRTWDITHRGTIEGMWENEDFQAFASTGCLILYEVKLDHIPEEPYTQKQLYDYMQFTTYKKIDGFDMKYFNYVQSVAGPGFVSFPESIISAVDKSENTVIYNLNNVPFVEGELYAISVSSPSRGYFERLSEQIDYTENANMITGGVIVGSIVSTAGLGAIIALGAVTLDVAYEAYMEYHFPSSKPNNVLQFSTLEYAKNVGCVHN